MYLKDVSILEYRNRDPCIYLDVIIVLCIHDERLNP